LSEPTQASDAGIGMIPRGSPTYRIPDLGTRIRCNSQTGMYTPPAPRFMVVPVPLRAPVCKGLNALVERT
jgi:hypothetical protein